MVQLSLVPSERRRTDGRYEPASSLATIDLFCGAGGITEGFRQAGYNCLYANDSMPEAISTFAYNHPKTWAECGHIEEVDASALRERLRIARGALDVLVGGPPAKDSRSMRLNDSWTILATACSDSIYGF